MTTNESHEIQPTARVGMTGSWGGEKPFRMTKEEVLEKMDEGNVWVFSDRPSCQIMDSDAVSEADFTAIGKLLIVPSLVPGKVRGRGRRRRRPVSQRWVRLQRLLSRNRPDWGPPRGEFP